MRKPPLPPTDAGSISLDRPSKTQQKKAMHNLQDLGEALLTLPDDRLARIDLPESLRLAVRDGKTIRAHEGRRRHMQYIGKLMRMADADAIREAVAAYQLGAAKDSLDLHRAERWRLELSQSDDALTAWMNDFPLSDAQHLRTLIRSARKEAALPPEQRHGRAWRELFQCIKAAMLGQAPNHDEVDDHG